MKKRVYIKLFVFVAALLFATLLIGCFGNDDEWKEGEIVQLSAENFLYIPEGRSYEYKGGLPVTIENDIMINDPINRTRVPNSQFTFAYENNINVGTAVLTVTANADNEFYFGSVEIHFNIIQGRISVNSTEELTDALNGDNVYLITVNCPIDLKTDVTVKEDVTLKIQSSDEECEFVIGGKLINNGTIKIDESKSAYNGISFINEGTVINNGKITVEKYGRVYNGGVFENNGSFIMNHSLSYIFTNDNEIPNVVDFNGEAAKQHIRTALTEENVRLEYDSVVYGYKDEYKPLVIVYAYGEFRYVRYTYEYFNYDRAGTASVQIKIDRLDEYYYGETTVEYEIERGFMNVFTPEDIETYQKTGNFSTYIAQDDFIIPENTSFTLNEDETLRAKNIYIYGTFINEGNIRVSTSPGSRLDTEGFLYVNKNNEGSGRFENRGVVDTESFILLQNGSAVNSGTINTTDRVSLQSPFVNETDGILNFNDDVNFFNEFTNNGEVNIVPSIYVLIDAINYINNGKTNIDGEIVCRSLTEFANNGTWENTGTVWSYIELPSDFNNLVVKRQITPNDIVFASEKPSYDGTEKPAILSESTHLKEGQFYIEYTYEGSDTAQKNAPINAGKMTLFIQITDELTPYYMANNRFDTMGTIENIEYEILRGRYDISTAQELYEICLNHNYGELRLINDVTFTEIRLSYNNTQSSFTIAEGVTLDTNGFALIIDGSDTYVNNYGTILNSKVGNYAPEYEPTVDKCGVRLLRGAKINNHGTVINENIFYVDRNSDLCEYENSIVINRGLMYLTSEFMLTDGQNTGEIFFRERMSDLITDEERIILEYRTIDYDGTEKTPWVKLLDKNNNFVDLEERFTVTYINYVSERLCYVTVKVKNEFDKEFVGACTAEINVVKGIKKLESTQDFAKAVDDPNYIGYELVKTFNLTHSITLPGGTFLDLGLYGIGFSSSNMIDFSAGAELWVSVDSVDRFQRYAYIADKLTFVSDIDDTAEMKIDLVSYKMGTLGSYKPYTKSYNGITIDINGHNIGGSLNWINEYQPNANTTDYYVLNIVDTAENKGMLGSGITKHGLYIKGNERTIVNLNGVRVGGMELAGSQGGLEFTATDCEFITTATIGNAQAAYYCASRFNVDAVFNNCTFEGVTGAYINASNHNFNNCTFVANGEYIAGESGSGIIIKRVNNNGSPRVNIDGGKVSSVNGYCLEIINVIETNDDIKITRRTNIDSDNYWTCGIGTQKIYGPYAMVESI